MKPETRSFYELAVRRAAEHVASNLDRALDLRELARRAALSPFHFHRVFRGMVGETPLELHRRLRLERAAWQVLKGALPVTRIAFDAGYETHEAFTRAFRARYGQAPSELRQAVHSPNQPCVAPRFELAAASGLHFQPSPSGVWTLHFKRGASPMDVQVKTLTEQRVATVTHVGPYNQIAEAFARLDELAGKAGLLGPSTRLLAIYHDDPESTPPAELRSEAGVTVAAEAVLPPGVSERRLPAGRYACTLHVGPYEHLGDVWSRFLGEWLPESGERVRAAEGLSFESYLNTPATVPKEQLQTELYIPLETPS